MPTSIDAPVGELAGGREHAGRRADDEPLGGEQVLALELRVGAIVGAGVDPLEQLVEVLGRGDRDRAGAVDACAWPCR